MVSLVALVLAVYAFWHIGKAAFRVATDSFVAPIVLSPESDLVLPSKLNLARMQAERDALAGQVEQNEASLRADSSAIHKLRALQHTIASSLAWTDAISAQSRSSSAGDLHTLAEQQSLVARQISEQEAYVRELTQNLQTGLIHRSDLLREKGELSRLRMAALQLKRERRSSASQLHVSQMTQQALHPTESTIESPEVIQQREHQVKVELDLLRLDTEMRTKQQQVQTARAEIEKLDALILHVKARPVFRAVDAEQNVAFVPYSQMERVRPGAEVLDCELWGLFMCEPVGRVKEVIAGEVVAQDPWGSPARGQYALLALKPGNAAQSKVLHIR